MAVVNSIVEKESFLVESTQTISIIFKKSGILYLNVTQLQFLCREENRFFSYVTSNYDSKDTYLFIID